MNVLRKSLSRLSSGRGKDSEEGGSRLAAQLEEERQRLEKAKVGDTSSSNKRKSMREQFDKDSLSVEEKLRRRARTSLRRNGNDLAREPVDW
jgi:hypothetical protein